MCEKCIQNDKQIARIRMLLERMTDQVTVDRFAAMIEEYEAEKRKLHPTPEE